MQRGRQPGKESFTFCPGGIGSAPSAARCRQAFTLIELMIVIGIIGIVCTVGIPSMVSALKKEGIRKAVSDVQEVCSYARAAAIFGGETAQLAVNLREKTFSIRAPGGGGSAQNLSFQATLPEDVHIELMGVNFIEMQDEEDASVRFHPNGTCDEFAMVLRSDRGEVRKITLDIVTGLSDVEEVR